MDKKSNPDLLGIGMDALKQLPRQMFDERESKSKAAPHGKLVSVRNADHGDHKITITTTYEIEVDGSPFTGHLMVLDDGTLHCHGIPYQSYASVVDLMRDIVDLYPESFRTDGRKEEE